MQKKNIQNLVLNLQILKTILNQKSYDTLKKKILIISVPP